jgi:hypothetical protein
MKSMKKFAFLILTLTILILIISTAQAADYVSLKNEYVQNHPGQSIIPFSWEASTSEKVLPFNYTIPATPSNNISITASRDQFESGTFIISAQKDLSGIQISVPNLYSTQGNTLQSDAINIRLVKVWYQAGQGDMKYTRPDSVLTPELLVKDDSLVKVDYVNKINFLKVIINGIQQYIDISNPNATFPMNAQIQDSVSLQPFSLQVNENKQIWLTVQIPNNTPAGTYYGDITLSVPNEIPVKMNLSVTVLPFDLEPSPIEYAIFYSGRLPSWPVVGININQNWKTPTQYSLELQNMKEHGVLYPTIYTIRDPPDESTLGTALSLRAQSSLPRDHLYFVGSGPGLTGNATSQSDLNALKTLVTFYKNNASQHGFNDIYIYGMDERTGTALVSERTAWQAVHDSGAKVFATCYSDAFGSVGDLLDVAVMNNQYGRDTSQVAQWHSYGHKIFSYAYPQVGMEDPEIYRKNYGFILWNDGYDGAMPWAYQTEYGNSIWNDFDSADTGFRDHVFAYPTSNGVIDTIQWEGWREGVDDTRYIATLMKNEGSDTSARAIVADSLTKGEEMQTIRNKIIQQIIASEINHPPVLSSFGNKTNVGVFQPGGKWYLDIKKNGILDGTPTDRTFAWGKQPDDIPITGDWNGDNITETGIFRSGGTWYLDMNNNGAWDGSPTDRTFSWGKQPDDIPITGDWNGDNITETGIFRSGGTWYLDMNNNGIWEGSPTDTEFSWGKQPGDIPITGDWNGDGITETGIFRPGSGFYLDMNNNGAWDPTSDTLLAWGLQPNDIPVTGDWNGDGITETGIFRNGDLYLDINNNGMWDSGTDVIYPIGQPGDKPITGKW